MHVSEFWPYLKSAYQSAWVHVAVHTQYHHYKISKGCGEAKDFSEAFYLQGCVYKRTRRLLHVTAEAPKHWHRQLRGEKNGIQLLFDILLRDQKLRWPSAWMHSTSTCAFSTYKEEFWNTLLDNLSSKPHCNYICLITLKIGSSTLVFTVYCTVPEFLVIFKKWSWATVLQAF